MENPARNRVLLIRTHKGMSQKAVASAMDITQPCYSMMERNWQNARIETLERLAKALGTTVDKLMDLNIPVEQLAR
jgi:transcriptional regulator with XRE-family HTH domain